MFVLTGAEASDYSDLHKDVYGWRPRDFTFNSAEAFEEHYDLLRERLIEVLDEERTYAARALDSVLLQIQTIATQFAITRATALRWLMQAHETNDLSEFAYENGLYPDHFTERALREFTFKG